MAAHHYILTRLACMPLRSPAQTHVKTKVNRHIFQALAQHRCRFLPHPQVIFAPVSSELLRSVQSMVPEAFARNGAA
jgi:hypothetical protein